MAKDKEAYTIRRLNAIDLDGTITIHEFGDGVFHNRYEDRKVAKVLQDTLEFYWDYPEQLVKQAVNDTEDGLLGRIIKTSLKRGDFCALLTFNKCKVYTEFMLALLGLSTAEIDELFIRTRVSGDHMNNKNAFIQAAKDAGVENTRWWVALLDDNERNCSEARNEGYFAVLAKDVDKASDQKPAHLVEYIKVLGLSEEELEKDLEPLDARMQNAFNIICNHQEMWAEVEEETCESVVNESDEVVSKVTVPGELAAAMYAPIARPAYSVSSSTSEVGWSPMGDGADLICMQEIMSITASLRAEKKKNEERGR